MAVALGDGSDDAVGSAVVVARLGSGVGVSVTEEEEVAVAAGESVGVSLADAVSVGAVVSVGMTVPVVVPVSVGLGFLADIPPAAWLDVASAPTATNAMTTLSTARTAIADVPTTWRR